MYQARLLHSASPGQSYDATGNRLSGKVDTTTQTYTYPATNHRLSAVVMNCQYNGRGEQVRKFLGTASTYTLYDETGHWLGDYDNNGAALQQAIWLDDLPVGMLAGNSLHYMQPDHLTTCASGETYAVGRLTRMQDGSGITDYCYDRFGDLVHKVQTTNGKVFVLRYAYTKAGQLSQLTYPDGAAVDYVRNAQGQTTEVGVTPAGGTRQVLLGNATYYPFGPVASWSYGNGRPMQRVLDQDYHPLAVSDTRSDGLSTGFAFDPAGNLSALTAAGNTAPVVSLNYDALGRLTAFKDGPTGTVIDGYSYDATGNRRPAGRPAGEQRPALRAAGPPGHPPRSDRSGPRCRDLDVGPEGRSLRQYPTGPRPGQGRRGTRVRHALPGAALRCSIGVQSELLPRL